MSHREEAKAVKCWLTDQPKKKKTDCGSPRVAGDDFGGKLLLKKQQKPIFERVSERT